MATQLIQAMPMRTFYFHIYRRCRQNEIMGETSGKNQVYGPLSIRQIQLEWELINCYLSRTTRQVFRGRETYILAYSIREFICLFNLLSLKKKYFNDILLRE